MGLPCIWDSKEEGMEVTVGEGIKGGVRASITGRVRGEREY